MKCPECGTENQTVKDSRLRLRGWVRKRQCNVCGYEFRTVERYSWDTLEEIENMQKEKKRLTPREEQRRENIRRIKEQAKKLHIKLQDEGGM